MGLRLRGGLRDEQKVSEKAEAMVLELLALGVETSIIIRASGLSEQEVLSLKSLMGRH